MSNEPGEIPQVPQPPEAVTARRASLMPSLPPRDAETTAVWKSGSANDIALNLAKDVLSQQNPDLMAYVGGYYDIERARLDRKIERILSQRRFNGRTGEQGALLVPPDPEVFSDLSASLSPDNMRSFIGFIALSSTGRGNIGAFSYRVDLALKDMKIHDISPHFVVRLKALNAASIDAMIRDSQAIWGQDVRNGLRTILQGGLPGLGKRF